jgi:hypothetical protein
VSPAPPPCLSAPPPQAHSSLTPVESSTLLLKLVASRDRRSTSALYCARCAGSRPTPLVRKSLTVRSTMRFCVGLRPSYSAGVLRSRMAAA